MKQIFLRSAILSCVVVGEFAGLALAAEPPPRYIPIELTTTRPAAAAPVRLPPVEVLMLESTVSSTPFFLTPIANLDLEKFRTAPEVKLGIGQPSGEKPSIGGWISIGATSGGLLQ